MGAYLGGRIDMVKGDITLQDTEAIVNAADNKLLGGGGVDGAIHTAGGPKILEECRRIGGCPTGEARITAGGRLKARYVIHTVGPVYRYGSRVVADLLAAAYRNSLALASKHRIKSIAFPSISTGIYGYPIEEAAPIAIEAVDDYLDLYDDIELVRFVLFNDRDYTVYGELLGR